MYFEKCIEIKKPKHQKRKDGKMTRTRLSPLGQLAIDLFEIGAVKTREQSPDGKGFRLKLHEKNPAAPLSPIYLNLRTSANPKPGPLTPEAVSQIAISMRHLASQSCLPYDVVVGVPNAGDPIAEAFARRTPCERVIPNLLRLGKEEKDGKRQIGGVTEGAFVRGDVALVIDDLITGADSKLEALEVLENAGLVVHDVLVLVERGQGGREQLAKAGYGLHSLFTLEQLVDLYHDHSKISAETYVEIKRYLAA
jgi:uridine monophosphate synthetase